MTRRWLGLSFPMTVLLLCAALARGAEDVREVWRSQLGIALCIAADSADGSAWLGMGNSVVHLSAGGELLTQTNGFWAPQGIAVDPADRSVWVADTCHNQIVRLAADGTETLREDVFGQPFTISLNVEDRSVWAAVVVSPGVGEVIHLDQEGVELSRTAGFSWELAQGQCVSVDHSDGSCLVADTWHRRIVRLNAAGYVVWEQATGVYSRPSAVQVNQADGSFWVGGTGLEGDVSHFSKEGAKLWQGLLLSSPCSIAVNPSNGSCWVSGTGTEDGATIIHLASDGTVLWKGFPSAGPMLALDQAEGSCWAAGGYNNYLVQRFAADHSEVLHLDTPPPTGAIAANTADGSCWVELGDQLAHLAPDGTELWRSRPFARYIYDLAVNPVDGSVWVAGEISWTQGLVHFSESGEELWRGGPYPPPWSVSLNPADGSVWVADGTRSQLLHISADGTELYRGSFSVGRVAVDSTDGSVWAGGDRDLVHLATDGRLLSAPWGPYVRAIGADPRNGSAWVVDSDGARLQHLASDGSVLGQWEVPGSANSISVNAVDGTVWMSGTQADHLYHLAPDGTILWQGAGLFGDVSVSPLDGGVWVSQGWLCQVAKLLGPPAFPDVPWGHWADREIAACVGAGIVSGYDDGLYHPEWPVTRDQMAVYIARALVSPSGDAGISDPTPPPSFSDVPSTHWAYKHIEYAVSQAVVQGYEDGTYHPEYEVTRDQMAVYVARALVAPTGEAALVDYVPTDPRDFPDVADTFWAYKHIEYCAENGVVQGYLDGMYHPEVTVTRDQMAVYVARAFGL